MAMTPEERSARREAIKFENRELARAIREVQARSPEAFRAGLDEIAQDVAREARQNAPGSIASRIDVKRTAETAYVVAVKEPTARWIGGYVEYGTLASRKTPRKKSPGRRYSQQATGIKPRRFLRRAAGKKAGHATLQSLLRHTEKALRKAGFDTR